MTAATLWMKLYEHHIARTHPFDRDFIWIPLTDFDQYRPQFQSEWNILHTSGGSYRSRHLFCHVHAVEQGSMVFIHRDTGNLRRFFPLALVHLLLDVLPYAYFVLTTHTSFTEHIYCPKKSLEHSEKVR